MSDIAVIGCGVSGLSTAILLQERGLGVRIVARDPPAATTSAVAAAVWYPYRAYPQDKVLDWGARTFRVFERLAADPRAGVRLADAVELWRGPAPEPWWGEAVRDLRHLAPSELPAGYAGALAFTTAIADMPVYLDYLRRRFEGGGGAIETRALTHVIDVPSDVAVIVNCSGLGAHDLFADQTLAPIRGQVVRVSNPGLTSFLLDEAGGGESTYIVPRVRDCVLGGTAEVGSWSLEPNADTAAAILARCIALEPRLKQAKVLEHRVGLRPGRPSVRLELEVRQGGRPCVHNYGHGGAGVTLSWGCAEDAAALVEQAFRQT